MHRKVTATLLAAAHTHQADSCERSAEASAQRPERAHREQSEMIMLVAAAGAATSARSSGTSGDPARSPLSARAPCPDMPAE